MRRNGVDARKKLEFLSALSLIDVADADITARLLATSEAWMIRIDIRRHAERFPELGDGHEGGAARPSAHAGLLVRETLQLEFFVEGPLDALIVAHLPLPLDEADEDVEDEGGGDEEAADDEDDDDAEGGEVHRVVGGADALVVAHRFRDGISWFADVGAFNDVRGAGGVLHDGKL